MIEVLYLWSSCQYPQSPTHPNRFTALFIILIYCTSFVLICLQSSFGHVTIPSDFQPPSEYLIGSLGFDPPLHNVHADKVYVMDTQRIRIENLNYDGLGPGLYSTDWNLVENRWFRWTINFSLIEYVLSSPTLHNLCAISFSKMYTLNIKIKVQKLSGL